MKSHGFLWISSIMLSGIFISCSTEPEPIVYGKDQCHLCKMTLVDQKYGAEIVTQTGKVYKFDDIKCFLQYYHSGFEDPEKFIHKLVIDYVHPGHLIQATDAFYLKSDQFNTPMSGQVAAFEKMDEMNRLKKKSGGIYLAWGEVITQFK